jgi:hypothetical protein
LEHTNHEKRRRKIMYTLKITVDGRALGYTHLYLYKGWAKREAKKLNKLRDIHAEIVEIDAPAQEVKINDQR